MPSSSICSRVAVWHHFFHFGQVLRFRTILSKSQEPAVFQYPHVNLLLLRCLALTGKQSTGKNDTLKILVHPRCVIWVFAPPLLFDTRSLDFFFFFFCQAVGQEQILVQQLGASLLFWCRQLPVMRMVRWEPAQKSQGR